MGKILCVLLAALIALSAPCAVHSAETVYISTETELFALSASVAAGNSYLGVSVYLTADISLSRPFTPIGADEGNSFCGAFYGGGHTISGLTITRDSNYCGLFGLVTGGRIEGVNLKDARIQGGNYCGALVGRIYSYEGYSAVKDCTATATVTGGSYVGGLIGLAKAAAFGVYAEVRVTNCVFNGTVKGDIYTGGIAGKAEAISTSSRAESLIENCKSEGLVTATGGFGTMAGGICGGAGASSNGGSAVAGVSRCLSLAAVSASKAAAGGICGVTGGVGYGATAYIKDSVVFGSVSATALAGGVAGKCEQSEEGTATVTNSVQGGTVTGASACEITAGITPTGCFTAKDKNITYPIAVRLPEYSAGDVNGDGVCDNTDALSVLKYDAGLAFLGIAALGAGDVNGDGVCDNTDAALILKYDAGVLVLPQ